MTSSLAKLLRRSISNEQEVVTVAEEAAYTETYLSIQKMRYKDKLEYEIAIEKEVLQAKVVKLILQPLVENSIYHGIKYKEGKGTVRIAGYLAGGCTCLDGEVRGGLFHCSLVTLPASLPEGRYTLCLREQMWRPAGNGPYALTVKEVRFRGPETMVALAAEDGTLFQKRFPGPASFQAGDVLRFHLDMGDPVLFPREEGL